MTSWNTMQHISPRFIKPQGRLTFAFVRNPLTWLESNWRYKTEKGWRGNDFDVNVKADTFEQFLKNYLKYYAGLVSNQMLEYAENVDIIGKFEDLENDLIEILNKADEKFDEKKLRSCQPTNRSNTELSTKCSDELKIKIYESEKKAFEKLGYE